MGQVLLDQSAYLGRDSTFGSWFEMLGDLGNISSEAAEKVVEALLVVSGSAQDTFYLARSYAYMSVILSDRGDNPQALEYCYRALDLAEATQDSLLIMRLQNDLGTIHSNIGDLPQAILYYQRLITYASRLGDRRFHMSGLLNLAYPYLELQVIDTAEHYLNQALVLAREYGYQDIEAYALGNLAYVYAQQNNYQKAIEYQLAGLEIERELADNFAMIDSYGVLSTCYSKLGDVNQTRYFFDKALELATRLHANMKLIDIYKEGQHIFANVEDYPTAFNLSVKYQSLNDSLLNLEKNEQLVKLREQYETAKKEAEISQLKEDQYAKELELKKQQQTNLLLMGFGALLLIVAMIVMIALIQIRKQKKVVDQRNETITKINKALNKSQDDLIASNKTKDKFFALIAHDLRGPITSMQGIGRMLAYFHKKGDEDRIHELISQVDQSAQSVNHLLDNLLKWALSQTNGLNYQPTEFALNRLVEECTLIFDENLKAKQITLHQETEGDYLVKADYNMISAVLRNLLSNAIKFTPTGGHVTLTATAESDRIRISVTDTGTGIPIELIEKLKEQQPLSSTRGTEGEKGTGLGLTLCREFAMRHHSELEINSSSQGTTISFELPLFQHQVEV